jgi:hypothetical protein
VGTAAGRRAPAGLARRFFSRWGLSTALEQRRHTGNMVPNRYRGQHYHADAKARAECLRSVPDHHELRDSRSDDVQLLALSGTKGADRVEMMRPPTEAAYPSSCSVFKSSRNSRSATVAAAIAVRSDLNGPSRNLTAKGFSSRKISHSHCSRAILSLVTLTRYKALRRWSAIFAICVIKFSQQGSKACSWPQNQARHQLRRPHSCGSEPVTASATHVSALQAGQS